MGDLELRLASERTQAEVCADLARRMGNEIGAKPR